MKGITNKQIKADLKAIGEMSERYRKAIWEEQEGQEAHYDHQEKSVRQLMTQVCFGLGAVWLPLDALKDLGVKEDADVVTVCDGRRVDHQDKLN